MNQTSVLNEIDTHGVILVGLHPASKKVGCANVKINVIKFTNSVQKICACLT